MFLFWKFYFSFNFALVTHVIWLGRGGKKRKFFGFFFFRKIYRYMASSESVDVDVNWLNCWKRYAEKIRNLKEYLRFYWKSYMLY